MVVSCQQSVGGSSQCLALLIRVKYLNVFISISWVDCCCRQPEAAVTHLLNTYDCGQEHQPVCGQNKLCCWSTLSSFCAELLCIEHKSNGKSLVFGIIYPFLLPKHCLIRYDQEYGKYTTNILVSYVTDLFSIAYKHDQ